MELGCDYSTFNLIEIYTFPFFIVTLCFIHKNFQLKTNLLPCLISNRSFTIFIIKHFLLIAQICVGYTENNIHIINEKVK